MTGPTVGAASEILIDRDGPLTRAAVLTGGRLTDLYIDHAERPSLLGHVFLGRVERIATGLDGAFVDLGTGKSGLLSALDARGPKGRPKAKGERIGNLLRTGQTVLVQVRADATGAKGPSLTMDITLPGRFLVHAPLGRDVAVSKRLGSGPERTELARRIQDIAPGTGWIVRAGAATAPDGLLAAESDALHLAWRQVRDAAERGGGPSLLLTGPDAPRRALIEHGAAAPSRIIVDDAALARDLADWCADRAPDLEERVEPFDARLLAAPSDGRQRLFDLRDLDAEIETLLGTRVPLSGGGSLVIERTEAMTVVDVNAGERGNPLDVNLEAAAEIARQLRLRNAGGIVVVDFVNMRNRGDAERLLNALSRAVEDDPAQTQVYGLSKLGLVEMTRARRGTALAELLGTVRTAAAED
ncbi:ribonuclease E/G [Azospirillum brasilense]|uniref:ribonuclease E/G n=1 Tax=Azospirillum brasilense TaxID=192 RepID=UPI000E6A1CE7|nr:ribonuclease E/G [Azospirillum brasilense]NUB24936.1 ribonuclease E [Azospirillum brasilense]NUB30867.1 ribonuclease E [Azospirillum brasilense]RIW02194.1 ribonuclease E [Azospirillum brasilense]